MLLPILILEPNVKKCLNNPFYSGKQQGLSKWIWKLFYTIIGQLSYFPIAATIPAKTYSLPRWVKQNLYEQSTEAYSYVFTCHKQKNQQLFQQMTSSDQQILLEQLKSDYSQILIYYFTTEKNLKEKIDKFINAVFYASIPVPQIIKIHMELIEEFSIQLKLEGRSDETLLDYRLTLIDILAHLCEVYRGSISK
ncbi:KaiA family protein [aff. Roholtiella sp. LEGE 12411]|uniref:KaiA family protein n=1 Tax=aff. Roholtiella sp. LEGE 12411 TaxID=1828822 RepID=UPI0018826C6E|nr:KaiA family protein [aff. Roholtiella sp. LEGE 12411]MBE9036733.1 KaiA family protein [aff. Roholtiella sp. LEGE 12411]